MKGGTAHEISSSPSVRPPSFLWSSSACSASSNRLQNVMCRNPFMQGNLAFGCGQCLHCRLNRRRTWAHRMMLESHSHEFNCFVTLTYSNEYLPEGGTLVPRHPQLFLKRLRKRYKDRKIRYYLVGEYGDISQRPHYHLMLYGLSTLEGQVMSDCWQMGGVMVGNVTPESCEYVAGYVTKKMTKADDQRLEGRHPEFARMSLRPGIGAHAMVGLADDLRSKGGSLLLTRLGDVPNEINYGKKAKPLGRYLKKQLRRQLDIPERGLANPALEPARESMRNLLKGYETAPSDVRKAVFLTKTESQANAREKRYRIFTSTKKGKVL